MEHSSTNRKRGIAQRWFSVVRELNLGPMVRVLSEMWRLLAKGQPVSIEQVREASEDSYVK